MSSDIPVPMDTSLDIESSTPAAAASTAPPEAAALATQIPHDAQVSENEDKNNDSQKRAGSWASWKPSLPTLPNFAKLAQRWRGSQQASANTPSSPHEYSKTSIISASSPYSIAASETEEISATELEKDYSTKPVSTSSAPALVPPKKMFIHEEVLSDEEAVRVLTYHLESQSTEASAGAKPTAYYSLTSALAIVKNVSASWTWGELLVGHSYLQRHLAEEYAAKRMLDDFKKHSLHETIDIETLELWHHLASLNYVFAFPAEYVSEKLGVRVVAIDRNNAFLRACYAIIVDDKTKRIILLFRGTKSVSDLITDLHAHPTPFEYGDAKGFVHYGILQTAEYFAQSFVKDLLRRQLEKNPDYTICSMGHSLGAGTAALLALIWRQQGVFPEMECFAFACPCTCSRELANYCSSFVTTFVNGDDIVPYLSIMAVHDLYKKVATFPWREYLSHDLQNTTVVKLAQKSSAYIRNTASALYCKSMSLFSKKMETKSDGNANTDDPASDDCTPSLSQEEQDAAEKALVGSLVQDVLYTEDDEGQTASSSNDQPGAYLRYETQDGGEQDPVDEGLSQAAAAIARMMRDSVTYQTVSSSLYIQSGSINRTNSPIGISGTDEIMYYATKSAKGPQGSKSPTAPPSRTPDQQYAIADLEDPDKRLYPVGYIYHLRKLPEEDTKTPTEGPKEAPKAYTSKAYRYYVCKTRPEEYDKLIFLGSYRFEHKMAAHRDSLLGLLRQRKGQTTPSSPASTQDNSETSSPSLMERPENMILLL